MIVLISMMALAAPQVDTVQAEQKPTEITLEQALQIALSENISVKVADKEIERAQYAKKGSYAALFPKVDGSASFQRTIEKQVMYMDFDMSSIMGGAGAAAPAQAAPADRRKVLKSAVGTRSLPG